MNSTINIGKENVARLRLEYANGEVFSFAHSLRGILATQDMAYWIDHPKEFEVWLRGAMADMVSNVQVVVSKANPNAGVVAAYPAGRWTGGGQ